MRDSKKRDDQPQYRLFRFIIAWALGCFLASWLYLMALTHLITVGIVTGIAIVLLVNLGLFACIATVQFFVIRRFLFVKLRGWVPMAVVGVIVGIAVLELLPRVIEYDTQQPLARFSFVLMWIMPAICQWILLRKRFVYHGLWLLAAVILGPVFTFVFRQGDGIFRALLPDPDWMVLRTAAGAADFVLPSTILGLVLYVVIIQGGKADKAKRSAQ